MPIRGGPRDSKVPWYGQHLDAPGLATSRPVILSKMTTPLQRLQQKLKMEVRVLQQKHCNRHAEILVAMRLPLAPTTGMFEERLWKQKKSKVNKKKEMAGMGATMVTMKMSNKQRGDGKNNDNDIQ